MDTELKKYNQCIDEYIGISNQETALDVKKEKNIKILESCVHVVNKEYLLLEKFNYVPYAGRLREACTLASTNIGYMIGRWKEVEIPSMMPVGQHVERATPMHI